MTLVSDEETGWGRGTGFLFKKIPEQIVLGSKYVNERYDEIISSHTETDAKRCKNILWDIKEERDDGDINDTFEALSCELFREHKSEPNEDLSLLSELLNSVFENGKVLCKELVGTK